MIRYQNTDKDRLINQIIDMEFNMFDKVNGLNGRAPCQNDIDTFYAMRYSQHNAFSESTLQSYFNDLRQAVADGRNLITEKYGYMMEFTDSLYYNEVLKGILPVQSPEKLMLISEIMLYLQEDYNDFSRKYPLFSKMGRPQNSTSTVATIDIYNFGELKTYSYNTLQLYKNDLLNSRNQRETIVEKIQKQTSIFYGYKDIQDAEMHLKERFKNQ